MTTEEIINNIEEAPAEMQVAVAKAYLRDDIDNDDIQYHFNEDGINDLVEDGSVENVDEEEPEGIGAESFTMRTAKPAAGNKNFIRKATGGWSPCVKGNPTDKNCNVLSNCVGYACGRFNEIYNELMDTTGCKYNKLCCNAENFVERAQAHGLKTGSEPKVGAIMVWRKGATLSSSDGAGHVAIVERVNNAHSVYTSESSYGGQAFFNSTRTDSNGRWGASSKYTFRCFIYQPDEVQAIIDSGSTPTPEPTPVPPVPAYPYEATIKKGSALYNEKGTKYKNPCSKDRKVTVQGELNGRLKVYGTSFNPHTVYCDKSAIKGAVAASSSVLKVGDKVKIIGTGNGRYNGTGKTAYGIGWERQVLKIWDGYKYPYQIGNNTGTTGFYKAEALQKK